MFLCLGADLSAEDRQGQTSLSWACLKGRVAIAQYLLDRGAPLNHADKSGKTALDLATLNGNPALVQVSVKTKKLTKISRIMYHIVVTRTFLDFISSQRLILENNIQ